MNTNMRKIVMVGCGYVGATSVFSMLETCTDINVIDTNFEKTSGEILDMNHAISFIRPVELRVGDYSDCKDADVIVITAGASQLPGQTRNDLLHKNHDIFKSILDQVIMNIGSDTIILVVTNPVDALTYFCREYTGLPSNRVFGSGTVLDTARLKYATSQHTGIDARDIHAYVLGEHGDTAVAAFSATTIAGLSLQDYCNICDSCDVKIEERLEDHVRNAAYEIIHKKGSTFYGVSFAVKRIVEAILDDEKAILTVSSCLDGQYGMRDVALSLPCVVGAGGIEKIITPILSDDEMESLHKSAQAIQSNISKFR